MGERPSQAFENLITVNDLVGSLKKKLDSLNNTNNGCQKYICHYTSLEAARSIIHSKKWRLSSPSRMNDGLEYETLLKGNFKVFFSSFTYEMDENMAMWSMYAQPWEQGVMLRIPVQIFKGWPKSKNRIWGCKRNEPEKAMDITGSASFYSQAVAYLSKESERSDLSTTVRCGWKSNEKLNLSGKEPELAGFIKDEAWSYEKELRMRVDLNETLDIDFVEVDIPDNVIEAIEIVKGPRFAVGLETAKSDTLLHAKESRFTGKLNWTYCDNCLKKRIVQDLK